MPESNKTIGEIVAGDYRTAKVFEKHGIDFCCGGKVVLADICREKGLDFATLAGELEEVQSRQTERDKDYSSWELSFLIDYIINVHHGYLKENTGLIKSYTQKIAGVHGGRHPELHEIASIFAQIAGDLATHLKDEEDVFFPALKSADMKRKAGTGRSGDESKKISTLLGSLSREHDEVGAAIHRIRHLAQGYVTPDDACSTFVLAYKKLEEFELDLHKHVHLENNILFVKAGEL